MTANSAVKRLIAANNVNSADSNNDFNADAIMIHQECNTPDWFDDRKNQNWEWNEKEREKKYSEIHFSTMDKQ